MSYTGRCLCGAIRYRLDGELGPLVCCHCQFCRRAHGSAFSTIAWVQQVQLHFVAGEEEIARFGEGGGRHFCRRCATRLFNGIESMPDHVVLVVASLDQPLPDGPVAHINVESKASWYEILDGRPQYPAFPPGLGGGEDE